MIAAVGSSIANAAVSSSGKRSAQQRAQKYTERNMATAQQYTIDNYNMQYQGALDQWNRENAYNTPAAQMQRNVEAGLNPNLVAGAGGVQNTSGSMGGAPSASPSPAPAGASGQGSELNIDPVSAGRLQNETMLAQSQAALNQANANQLNALSGKTNVEAASLRAALPSVGKKIDAEIRNLLSSSGYYDAQTSTIPSIIALNTAHVMESGARVDLSSAQTQHFLASIAKMAIDAENETRNSKSLATQASAAMVQAGAASENAISNRMNANTARANYGIELNKLPYWQREVAERTFGMTIENDRNNIRLGREKTYAPFDNMTYGASRLPFMGRFYNPK